MCNAFHPPNRADVSGQRSLLEQCGPCRPLGHLARPLLHRLSRSRPAAPRLGHILSRRTTLRSTPGGTRKRRARRPSFFVCTESRARGRGGAPHPKFASPHQVRGPQISTSLRGEVISRLAIALSLARRLAPAISPKRAKEWPALPPDRISWPPLLQLPPLDRA